MSSQAVIPGIKLTQSQCLNIQNCCWIQSDDVLMKIFAFVDLKDIYYSVASLPSPPFTGMLAWLW